MCYVCVCVWRESAMCVGGKGDRTVCMCVGQGAGRDRAMCIFGRRG